jgi:glycosyltransferase involved in cell wall biosynthesis
MDELGVLILCPFFRPNVGGVETHLDDLCEYLRRKGYRVYVLTYQPLTTRARGEPLEVTENLEIRRIPWFGHNWFHELEPYPLLEFLYLTPRLLLAALLFLLRRGREIDVIHAHGLNATFIAALLASLFGKRAVASTHAIYNLRPGSPLAEIVKRSLAPLRHIFTLSAQSRDELVGIGIDTAKITVYTYWIDQELFRPLDKSESKRGLGWEGRFVVLFVGRLIAIKGILLLLEVAGALAGENILFAFIGDGPLEDELQERAKSTGNVIYVGRVDNRELPLYYSAADLVAVPSQYEEGFGRVILESLSCGTPVLAARRGGIPEALDPSVGVLVEPTAEQVREQIEMLHRDGAGLEKLRRNCRAYARRRFSAQNAEIIAQSYAQD